MRSPFLHSLVFINLLAGSLAVSAQRPGSVVATRPTASRPAASRPAASRLALASPAEATSTASPQLACAKINGQVLGADGKPIIGATITVKGTQLLYITNSDGKYLVENPVYQGQVLEIEAAGYVTRELSLTDCTVPAVALEFAPGTRIKKSGKRAGQIVRFGTADMQ